MSINSPERFEKLRACGMIVRKALRAMAAEVRAGITTAELCELGSRVLAAHGARSSPPRVYGFPGDVCISLNDEVVHGIPGDRVIQPGDLVKLDLTAEKDGYHREEHANWRIARSARSGKRSGRRAWGAARKTLDARSSAKCDGAVFMWCANSVGMASDGRFTSRRRCLTTR